MTATIISHKKHVTQERSRPFLMPLLAKYVYQVATILAADAADAAEASAFFMRVLVVF